MDKFQTFLTDCFCVLSRFIIFCRLTENTEDTVAFVESVTRQFLHRNVVFS